MVRSLSRAAHFTSVSRFFSTRPSNTVRPFATTLTGFVKSNLSADKSKVNDETPRVVASTVLPLRRRSTRPDGLDLSKRELVVAANRDMANELIVLASGNSLASFG